MRSFYFLQITVLFDLHIPLTAPATGGLFGSAPTPAPGGLFGSAPAPAFGAPGK